MAEVLSRVEYGYSYAQMPRINCSRATIPSAIIVGITVRLPLSYKKREDERDG
jgi:hypothetical protein